jgi:hypothetical protein
MPQIVIKNVQTSLLRSQSTLLNAHAATMLLFDLIKIWASGQAKKHEIKEVGNYSSFLSVTAIFGKICPNQLKHKITNHLGVHQQSICKEHSTNFIKKCVDQQVQNSTDKLGAQQHIALPTTILSLGYIRKSVHINRHKLCGSATTVHCSKPFCKYTPT